MKKIRTALLASLVAGVVLFAAAPASANAERTSGTASIFVWYNGIKVGKCDAVLNVRASDGYVQGKFESYDNREWGVSSTTCLGWVERRRTGAGGYDWTKVTDFYSVYNNARWSGWHWNGDNAGSRVCISDMNGPDAICSTGIW